MGEELKKILEDECEKHPDMKAKMEEVGEKMKAKKESLLQTDDGEGKDGEGKDGEGKDGEGKEDDDEEDFDFLGELGEKVKRKFKEVKEKIELAKNKRSKRSLLQTSSLRLLRRQ